jgi:hypothetical protein
VAYLSLLFASLFQLVELGGSFASNGSIAGDDKTFKIQGGATIHLKVPGDWQDVKDFMNAPLTLLGPERKGIRPVINFVSTGVGTGRVDESAFQGDVKSWQRGRQKFLKIQGGRLLEFYPYKDESWKSGVKAHIYGMRYQLGEAEIVSRSYYVECKSKLYIAKSLIRAENEAEFGPVALDTLRSFECE